MYQTGSKYAKQILADAIVSSTADRLPFAAPGAREAFEPMEKIRSTQELLWALDYIAEKYEDRIPGGALEGVGYLVQLETIPMGHPVYLLGTLYVLLAAGADVHVSFEDYDFDCLHKRILQGLLKLQAVSRMEVLDVRRRKESISRMRQRNISRIAVLGDAANMGHHYHTIEMMEGSSWHFPSACLLLTDYLENPVRTEKHKRFGYQCWTERIDYIGHRADTHEAEEAWLGFDYMDLLWGAQEEVNAWNQLPHMTDHIPAIIFTDRPRDTVGLPSGIEQCCDVVFFEDFDCGYPLYDFTQLL